MHTQTDRQSEHACMHAHTHTHILHILHIYMDTFMHTCIHAYIGGGRRDKLRTSIHTQISPRAGNVEAEEAHMRPSIQTYICKRASKHVFKLTKAPLHV